MKKLLQKKNSIETEVANSNELYFLFNKIAYSHIQQMHFKPLESLTWFIFAFVFKRLKIKQALNLKIKKLLVGDA